MTDKQISRTLLGALRGSGVNVKPDDVDELDIYVANGYEYLEEHHQYDPRQYATTTAQEAVKFYAAWQFCVFRPDLANLAARYREEFKAARIDWAGEAATQVNIHHNEYPENRTRVSWNNQDPLNQSTNVFGVDPNRLGS